jgi:hypothetical protein
MSDSATSLLPQMRAASVVDCIRYDHLRLVRMMLFTPQTWMEMRLHPSHGWKMRLPVGLAVAGVCSRRTSQPALDTMQLQLQLL